MSSDSQLTDLLSKYSELFTESYGPCIIILFCHG